MLTKKMDVLMIRSGFESIDFDRVGAPIFEEEPKCLLRKFSGDERLHKLGITHPLLPSIGNLPIDFIDIGFGVIPAHFNIHQSSSFFGATNLKFQAHFAPALGALIDKGLMNLWILIFVIDLCSTGSLDFQSLYRSEEHTSELQSRFGISY